MDIHSIYQIQHPMQYSNNREYRACLRQVFLMKLSKTIENPDEIDLETLDENHYDEKTVTETLKVLFEVTKDHPLFHELYVSAAHAMLSEEPDLGQVILFSYDYLSLFHPCLACFFVEPENFTETNEFYIALTKKLN